MNFEHATGLILGALIGAGIAALLLKRRFDQAVAAERMRREVERKEAELELREKVSEREFALKRREAELDAQGRENSRVAEQNESCAARLESREKQIESEQEALEEAEHEAKKIERLYRLKLHQISRMDREEARQHLIRSAEKECAEELSELRRRKLGRTENEVNDEARRILLAAMQRITSQPMNDATATIVSLPSEEMKGRIIGREGRNIRTFEHATGTTLMIDETPDSVLISCFDPVRREVARIALEALVRDGRIHPSSIEEEVQKAEQEMSAGVIDLGESALRKLRLHDVHPEVVGLLGRLHYRLSNNQNTLAHSVEVANLCALIASELGLDPVIAKRAGLFHDIGKAVDEDYSGSHALVGADVIKQHGEDPRVVNATAAHHNEVPAESAYAALVMVADSLSAVRPGARASSIDGFIERVRTIEDIAKSLSGVSDAYAIQAGREVRVIVEPEQVSDEEARQIARRLRNRIEGELNYPGTIEITVIRESRFKETAV